MERGRTLEQMEHSYREIVATQTANAPCGADVCSRPHLNFFSIEKQTWLTKAASGEGEYPAFSDSGVVKEAILPRVLVVDDDPMVCIAIEVCLQRQGLEVTIADGGEAGMRELASGDST